MQLGSLKSPLKSPKIFPEKSLTVAHDFPNTFVGSGIPGTTYRGTDILGTTNIAELAQGSEPLDIQVLQQSLLFLPHIALRLRELALRSNKAQSCELS